MPSPRFEVGYADSGGVAIAWTAVGAGPQIATAARGRYLAAHIPDAKGVPGRWELFAVDGEHAERPAALHAVS